MVLTDELRALREQIDALKRADPRIVPKPNYHLYKDEGSRYRVYDWVDGNWRGSGTLGPFDRKEHATEAVDLEFERHPDYTFCVVDRYGNIVHVRGDFK